MRTGQEELAKLCGQGADEPQVDWVRLHESVLALDPPTVDHVRRVAARGRELGRKRRSFGQVGDSMTASGAFLRPFSSSRRSRRFALGPLAAEALAFPTDEAPNGTIIDFYRGQQAQRVRGLWCDSFGAVKAAKVGARSGWALVDDQREQSPVAIMVRNLSPAIAVLTYGGNDAAFRVAPPAQIAEEFAGELGRVIDALERRGVVPILSTIARHGRASNLPDCGGTIDEMSNWRLAVQTNAVSAAAARLACRRHLPLVDLRHALDGIPNFGLGPDGVHPTAHEKGGGELTRRGLQCGYNVRNYVTLLMLARVQALIH